MSRVKESMVRCICLFLLMGLFTVFTIFPQSARADETYDLKLVHAYKKGSIWAEHIQIFGDMVERVTNEKIKFKYFYGGILYPTYKGYMAALVSGALQFAHMNTSLLTKYDPRWNVVFSPGVIWGWEHWKKFEKTQAYKNLASDLEKKAGLKILYWGCVIPGGDLLFNKKRPVRKLEDWEGLKIRTSPAESAIILVKAFGASPVVLSSPEVATALNQGVVDGGIITMATGVPAWSAQRTAPYVTIEHGGVSLGSMLVGIVANAKFWNSLPSGLREAIEGGIPDAQKRTIEWTDDKAKILFDKYKNTPGTKITYLTEKETKAWTDIIDKNVVVKLKEKYGTELIDAAIASRP